ncbi:MAG: S4 domain-containing protein [Candidatus Pacearchaeota archaeon]|jgi:small subunit ribosomal protein S4e
MHLKIQEAPKSWPIYRKGRRYVVRPSSNLNSGLAFLTVLRDMAKVVSNRKEARRLIFLKHVLLNNKIPKDEKEAVGLFDTISLVSMKKNYRIDISEKGKFELKEINESEANKKVAKLVDKKTLKGKKTQLNLQDGRNFLSEMKCSVNDSVLINFKDKKIEKCLPMNKGSRAVVFVGKHSGKRGEIKSIDLNKKTIEMETGDKEKLNVLLKQIIITE